MSAIVRRVLISLPLLAVVSLLSFLLVTATPGDAAEDLLGSNVTPEALDRLRTQLGLDKPLHERYLDWVGSALHGDLGSSLVSGQSVRNLIEARLPVTLSLIFLSLALSLILGVTLGSLSAIRGGLLGRAVDAFALVGFAIPAFWLGALLIAYVAVDLGWLPATGYVPFSQSPADWMKSLALPVVALALGHVATLAKQSRDAMLDVLSSPYISFAWANGVSKTSLILRHALKNVSMRIVTVLGLQAIGLLSGTVVVETVFALPGVGSLAVTGSRQHDVPTVQGVIIYFTIIVVAINLMVDLAYTWLNPKVRIS